MYDKMEFLKGLALGLAGKPLEFAPGKEPVAYLYNGVRLPKLPEWDRKKYPYVFIKQSAVTHVAREPLCYAFVMSAPFVLQPNQYYDHWSYWPDNTKVTGTKTAMTTSGTYDDADGNIFVFPEWEWSDNEVTYSGLKTGISGKSIHWANFDILDSNGSVYLPASYPINAETGEEIHDYEPIPVGGEPISTEPYE